MLEETMKRLLATTFTMYLKAHKYHWNVQGPSFSEWHGFLGNLYEELNGAADGIAEQIRALDIVAPGSYTEFFALSAIPDETNTPVNALSMFQNLLVANDQVITTLKAAHADASAEGNHGLVNFLEDRLDRHAKHGWMLRSYTR